MGFDNMSEGSAKEVIRRDIDSVTARILDAAQAEFMRVGYDRANTNNMARDFGLSKATIFRHFATKQELFEAVIARIAVRWHQRIDWQSIGDRPPAEWLTRFGTAALIWILEEETLFVGRMAITDGAAHAEARTIWPRLATRPILDLLMDRFANWHATGVLCSAEPERLAWGFLDLTLAGEVSRALYGSRITVTTKDVEDHVIFCVNLFLDGAAPQHAMHGGACPPPDSGRP